MCLHALRRRGLNRLAGGCAVTKRFDTDVTRSSNHIRYGVSLAALVFMTAPAFAQQQIPSSPTDAIQAGPSAEEQQQAAPPPLDKGDRVVVTARRVEEDVQDVPIAVAVLSSDFLSDTGGLQRRPPEGAGAFASVLFDQPP